MSTRQREPGEYLLGGLFFVVIGGFCLVAGLESPGWFGWLFGAALILSGIAYGLVGLISAGVRAGQSEKQF